MNRLWITTCIVTAALAIRSSWVNMLNTNSAREVVGYLILCVMLLISVIVLSIILTTME